jgi:hypothetical protein
MDNGSTGVYINPGDNGWTGKSDKRLKEDIKTLSNDNSLKIINQLNPVFFKWINCEIKKEKIGFIAQEVLEIFPHAVTIPSDLEKGHYGVTMTNFIPLIISGIQEILTIMDGDKSLNNINTKIEINEKNFNYNHKLLKDSHFDLKQDIFNTNKNNYEQFNKIKEKIEIINELKTQVNNNELQIKNNYEQFNKIEEKIEIINELKTQVNNNKLQITNNEIDINKLKTQIDNNQLSEYQKKNDLQIQITNQLLENKIINILKTQVNNNELQINELKNQINNNEIEINKLKSIITEQNKLFNSKFDILQNIITSLQKKLIEKK